MSLSENVRSIRVVSEEVSDSLTAVGNKFPTVEFLKKKKEKVGVRDRHGRKIIMNTNTTYNTEELMAGLCKILPRLDIVVASNVKINAEQARRLDAVFGEAKEGLPMSMLFNNIDGIEMEKNGFTKIYDNGNVDDEAIYVKAVKGLVKKYQPMFVIVQNNKVVDWNYLFLEHDDEATLLDWVGTKEAYYAFEDDNYSYLHHLAPWDSRRQEELQKMYEDAGFSI